MSLGIDVGTMLGRTPGDNESSSDGRLEGLPMCIDEGTLVGSSLGDEEWLGDDVGS